MDAKINPARRLAAYAREESFAPKTRIILSKLGFAIVAPGDLAQLSSDPLGPAAPPDLRIVDERRLGEVPEADSVPMIILTGRLGTTGADSRIVGAVRRPAGIHDLYRLLQQIFEDTPRATPRVATHLRAGCRRADASGGEWGGALLSLSENGCLLRSSASIELGGEIALRFQLPRSGAIEVCAEAAYQLVPDYGLVFSSLDAADRDAIRDYVASALYGD